MERKLECNLKIESNNPVVFPYSLIINEEEIKNSINSSSLGFMELFNMQDFGPIFDVLPSTETSLIYDQGSSEVLNGPTTPNSSSISSESIDGQPKIVGEEEEEQETKKNCRLLKVKKASSMSQKRVREPRFAFMTKSEVDHLEDGYRWRKYGQKAVKNSPFPRSYYRCTSASCNVKKRVERSFNDPSIVVTTYEGQHTHPSPSMSRFAPLLPFSSFSSNGSTPFPDQLLQSPHQPHWSYSVPLKMSSANVMNSTEAAHQIHSSAVLVDHGLLQDIVPWSLVKKEK